MHPGAAVRRQGGARIGARTLLVLDISDIAKPDAEKMQYPARVRDGSTREIAPFGKLGRLLAVPGDQSYEPEDIRVLTYERRRNMTVPVNAVAFFTAVVLATRIKLDLLATHLLKAAKRLFGIPDVHLYALADGIREVRAKFPRRSQPGAKDPPQLTLTFG